MIGSCNAINTYGNRCNSMYQLHNLLFRKPDAPTDLELVDLCKTHYDQLTTNFQERIKENTMKISNLIAQKARERRLAKDAGNYYDDKRIQQKIDDTIEFQKYVQTRECRNFLCMKDLTKLNINEKLYSVHSFRLDGRRQFTFYFCSLSCFNFMRGQCGIKTLIQKGQTQLEVS